MSDSSGRNGAVKSEGGQEKRSASAHSSGVGGIPRGIEILVKKASVDPGFREILLEKRAAAAAEIGLELSPAEATTLNSVPQSQIEQIIENTIVPDEHRRVFLGKTAAAMLAVLGLLGLGLSYAYLRASGPTVQPLKASGPTFPRGSLTGRQLIHEYLRQKDIVRLDQRAVAIN